MKIEEDNGITEESINAQLRDFLKASLGTDVLPPEGTVEEDDE